MKISSFQNIGFKGYAAGKIKALYMQNPGNDALVGVYNQLHSIGLQEGFDVFCHDEYELRNKQIEEPTRKCNPWSVWSQDNKTIINLQNMKVILSPKNYGREEQNESKVFSWLKKIPYAETDTIFDGGDIFLGKKPNGERYLMMSLQGFGSNAMYEYLKSKNPNNLTYYSIKKFLQECSYRNKDGVEIAGGEEYLQNEKYWLDLAKKHICEDFEVKAQNFFVLPNLDYHLDLSIKPLNYPYVLVSDDEEIEKLFKKLKDKFQNQPDQLEELNKFIDNFKAHKRKYFNSTDVCKTLGRYGFIPIKIAGGFGRGPVNFMNAVVQENKNGLIYITNSTKPSTPLFETMQDEFEKDLIEKCPQIKKVYFVSGGAIDPSENFMMKFLRDYKGGIHCMCCEEMEK